MRVCVITVNPRCSRDHVRAVPLMTSAIAHTANDGGTPLREAALASGYVSAAEFDRIVNPAAMAGR